MKLAIVGDPHVIDLKPRCRKDNYFDVVLGKIETVLTENDIVIFLGDIFSHPTVPFLHLNRIIELFAKYRHKQIISIVGNHDVYSYNIGSLPKTTLGLLDTIGLVDVKTAGFDAGGLHFEVVPLSMDLSLLPVDTNKSVLLGHCFFENNLDPKYSITEADILRLNYRYIFLGHDHSPYETKKIGESYLIRPGSLTRYEADPYNLKRIPGYIQINLNLGGMEYKYLDVTPAESIFHEDFLRGKVNDKPIDILDLESIINGFSRRTVTGKTVLKVLYELKASEESLEYLRGVHTLENVPYN